MIQRRIALAAIAAATLAAPAFAQMQDKGGAMSPSGGSDSMSKSGAAAGANDRQAMGEAEQKHIQNTMAVGAMSLLASRVAEKKARDEDVKEFAMFEVAEQETMADVLMSVQDPGKASGKMRQLSDAEIREHVPRDDMAMLEKMQQMEGKTFDRAYVTAQVGAHQKLLQIQEDYLASGNNAVNLGLAKLARGQIKEHIQLLADLKDDDDDKGMATTGESRGKK